MLPLDLASLLLPIDAEGRVGEEVVEGLAGELIVRQAVAELHIVAAAVVIHLLQQHVRGGDGVGAVVVVLSVGIELGFAVVVAQVVLRFGQHAAGAAGRVQQGAHHARGGQEFVVLDEQQVHHQADHFAGREVVASRLVGQFVEAANQVLEDEPHLLVAYLIRV